MDQPNNQNLLVDSDLLDAKKIVEKITAAYQKKVVGQDELRLSMLVALIANGHVLLESVPGLAKTLAAKTIAEAVLLAVFNVRQICYQAILLVRRFTITTPVRLRQKLVQSMRTSFSLTKLTAPALRLSLRCLRQCRSARFRLAA